jgi:arylsulfatase A-like enzyme
MNKLTTIVSLCVRFRGLCGVLSALAVIPVLVAENQADKDTSPKNDYNVVMIVLDAGRPDHLGFNGYPKNTSPNIDKLAEESIVFDNAIAQSDHTLPSFGSFLTSKYPAALQLYWTRPPKYRLSELEITLPEILKMHNYKTAAFVTGMHPNPMLGLNQGFDVYTSMPITPTIQNITQYRLTWSFNNWISSSLEWIEANKNQKFFLMLHSNDCHPPYVSPHPWPHYFAAPDYPGLMDRFYLSIPLLVRIRNGVLNLKGLEKGRDYPAPAPFSPEQSQVKVTDADIRHIIDHYDGGLAYADDCVGRIARQLQSSGLTKNTILIILSDHGEALYDRGDFNRPFGEYLYDEITRVILIVKHPDLQPQKITSQVSLIDLTPTLLDFAGIPAPSQMQGRSLTPVIKCNKEAGLNYAFSEASDSTRSIRSAEWKLIQRRDKIELYNLKNDPGEKNNLAAKKELIAKELTKILADWRNKNVSLRGPRESVELPPEISSTFPSIAPPEDK